MCKVDRHYHFTRARLALATVFVSSTAERFVNGIYYITYLLASLIILIQIVRHGDVIAQTPAPAAMGSVSLLLFILHRANGCNRLFVPYPYRSRLQDRDGVSCSTNGFCSRSNRF